MPWREQFKSGIESIKAALKQIDREVWDNYTAALIREAQHKDCPDAARQLVGFLADSVEGKRTLSDAERDYFLAALRLIEQGGSADDALNIKVARGKRPKPLSSKNTRIRDRLLAAEVQSLVDKGVQPTRNPLTEGRESACSIVADKYGFDEKHIEKIYYTAIRNQVP